MSQDAVISLLVSALVTGMASPVLVYLIKHYLDTHYTKTKALDERRSETDRRANKQDRMLMALSEACQSFYNERANAQGHLSQYDYRTFCLLHDLAKDLGAGGITDYFKRNIEARGMQNYPDVTQFNLDPGARAYYRPRPDGRKEDAD